MTHKEAVRSIEPNACVEKCDDGWLIRWHPEGRAPGGAKSPVQARQSARTRLFNETVSRIILEIPVKSST